ncbi:hypothetical protein ABKN59_003559 [Abortiporus biennis]
MFSGLKAVLRCFLGHWSSARKNTTPNLPRIVDQVSFEPSRSYSKKKQGTLHPYNFTFCPKGVHRSSMTLSKGFVCMSWLLIAVPRYASCILSES